MPKKKPEKKADTLRKAPSGLVKATFKTSDGELVYGGETIEACLNQLSAMHAYKGKSFLTVEVDGMKSERLLLPPMMKKVAFSKVFREILAKQISIRLK